ncbi:hypothetical protein D9M72_577200 [compost metagenome]
MDDDIGLPQRVGRMKRQQAGIAGAGTNEPHGAFLERRQSGKGVVVHPCCLTFTPTPCRHAGLDTLREEPDSICEETRTKD